MVHYAPKLTFGNTIADWQERIDPNRLRQERAARAKKIMRKYNIPAMVVATEENVRYLTGLKGPAYDPQLRYILFFAEHDPVIFEHAGYFQHMAEEAPFYKNYRIARSWFGGAPGPEASQEEADIFAADIYDELKSRGLAGDKVGVIGIDSLAVSALQKKKLNCIPSRPLLLEARSIKTKDEINCLRMVASIVESVAYKMWEGLKPGMKDTEIDWIINQASVAAGSDGYRSLNIHSGGPLSFPRGMNATGRIIQTGDMVYVAWCGGISYLSYRSCIYRSFKVGAKPTDQEKDWYKQMLERVNNVLDAIKPGATTADVAQHLPPASKWGYKCEEEILSIEFAHGLGLGPMGGGYDQPVINRIWSLKHPQVIEPGMAMAIECAEGENRVGGVRLEDMFIVTEKGAELIDFIPRDEILVAPR
jgi:Xaa-Pro aminopeptidase